MRIPVTLTLVGVLLLAYLTLAGLNGMTYFMGVVASPCFLTLVMPFVLILWLLESWHHRRK